MAIVIGAHHKLLEQRVYEEEQLTDGKLNITFKTPKSDKTRIGLMLFIEYHKILAFEKGVHAIAVEMPWRNSYELGKYENEDAAKRAFAEYDAIITNGGTIQITGPSTANILPKPDDDIVLAAGGFTVIE